jgi:hypothetical protein
MNHHPSGRTPVSAQPRTPPTQPTGQPQEIAPTVCYEPSPVGADPYVRPTTNATHTADGATTGVAPTICHCVDHHPSGRTPVSAQPRTPPTQAPPIGQPRGVAPTVCYEPSPVGAAPYVRPSVPHTTKADPGVAQPDARNLARSDDTEPPTIPYPYSHCWRSIPRRSCSSGSSRCEISQATHTRTRAARHRNLTHPATPVTEAAAV